MQQQQKQEDPALSTDKSTESDTGPYTAEQVAQIYKEGRNMGYLEYARDLDLKYASSGDFKEDYIGFNKAKAPDHLVDRRDARHPYNRGKETGYEVFGAVLATEVGHKMLDQRVYQSPQADDRRRHASQDLERR